MALAINTNVASLNAQNRLSTTGSKLDISLQRLSSGLRINTAKDDAAGLAITTRFSATIRGLEQATRNASNAISLAQVAEGALEEMTGMSQRLRELALQSANGTNTASDRSALQAEANQLKQEMQRISETTDYNGLKLINGDLANSEFQIGAFSNQTVSFSVRNMQNTNLGSNQVLSNNTNGIEAATYKGFVGGNAITGTDIGAVQAAATNGYTATTFTVTNSNLATGATQSATVSTTANDSAAAIATSLTAATGVAASGYNHVTLSGYSRLGATDAIEILDTAGTSINVFTATATVVPDSQVYSDIATAINNNASLSTQGFYAITSGTSVDIYNVSGEDISIVNTVGNSLTIGSNVDNAATTGTIAAAATGTLGGRVDVFLDQGYSIQANNTALLGSTANTDIAIVDRVGVADTLNTTNGTGAQTLTVSGKDGSTTVAVTAGQSAESVAQAINTVTGDTGVTAEAVTEVTIDGLTADGQVSFTLYGNAAGAGEGSSIAAAVTSTDLSALITKINDASGATGISAEKGNSNAQIKLKHSSGKDIKIENFSHTASVTNPSTAMSNVNGSAYGTPTVQSISITGSRGSLVKLSDGGNKEGYDSTIVGGKITFNSAEVFTVSSSIDGTGQSAKSLFSVAENIGQNSTLSGMNAVNIGTAAGAQSAISVIDEALNQISTLRADLGALQSRFESTVNNSSISVQNLSAARGSVLDTDYAAEMSALTKSQILSQAGISVLSQANSMPQAVLSLLQ